MIYLVLREPTATGYVNRFAYTDDPATTSVMCGGQSIAVTKGRIISIGEMGNRADISQAKGAVAQGVEGNFAIADWDGTGRTSAGIYAGQNRFYGWSVAIARHDTSTTPVWFNSEDHWCVTDLQIDGTSISVSVGERWALDGRLLAFGDNGTQVPLVVGGHDVWVPTVALTKPEPIAWLTDTGWKFGNPLAPTQCFANSSVAISKKFTAPSSWFFVFSTPNQSVWALMAKLDALIAEGSLQIQGATLSEVVTNPNYDFNTVNWTLGIHCSEEFYTKESAKDVQLFDASIATPIANGAIDVLGFRDNNEHTVRPKGTISVADHSVAFMPQNATTNGFTAYTLQPCSVAFVYNPSHDYASENYTGNVEDIITNEATPRAWGDPLNFRASIGEAGNVRLKTWGIPLKVVYSGDEKFDNWAVGVSARTTHTILNYDGANGLIFDCYTPFNSFNNHVVSTQREIIFDVSPDQIGAYLPQKIFSDVDAVNQSAGFTTTLGDTTYAFFCQVIHEVRSVALYGISSLSFGSSYALVKTGPSSLGSLTALDPYNVARAIIAYPMDSPDSIALNAAIPSYVPAAADFGECMDATKSYTVNGETIAQEAWLVFGQYVGGFVAAGEPNTSGQGIGEVPTAVALVLGRFEDIVTEPVIEYCNVAGTLTKKAYIANVDLDYDSTNPSKFFGGWGIGYDAPLDTIIDATGTWHRQGTGPIPSWTPTTTDGTDYGVGDWYYCIPNPAEPWGILESWFPAPSHDYGYLIWTQCRAAYKMHRVKRGQTYQFNGIYTDSVVGRMWWEAKRNGSRRIEWLCLQPRYLTYSVREDRPLNWAGSSVYIAGSMANYAGYDVSTWDNAGGDQLVVVEKRYNLQTAIATYTVAIPPLATVDTVPIYRDTINAALDRLVDIVDALAVTPKYIDTLEP